MTAANILKESKRYEAEGYPVIMVIVNKTSEYPGQSIVMYWGSWGSDESRTQFAAKGGRITAAVVCCRPRESDSKNRWWNGVRKWMEEEWGVDRQNGVNGYVQKRN